MGHATMLTLLLETLVLALQSAKAKYGVSRAVIPQSITNTVLNAILAGLSNSCMLEICA